MAEKKTAKNIQLVSEEMSESDSQFSNESPKPKKTRKRTTKNEDLEEHYSFEITGQYQASAKKKKAESSSETNPEPLKKILELVNNQLDARKLCNENLFKKLSEITTQVEADYNAMKDNKQKLEHLTGNYMKCIQQATTAYKHKLKALKEIHKLFKQGCDDMESDFKPQTEKVLDGLEYDMKKVQAKLVAETKRNSWESVRRSIVHAMRDDLKE